MKQIQVIRNGIRKNQYVSEQEVLNLLTLRKDGFHVIEIEEIGGRKSISIWDAGF